MHEFVRIPHNLSSLLTGSLRSARRIGRHGRTVLVIINVFAVDVLGARAELSAVLAAGVLLLEAVEFEFCLEFVD